MKQPEKTTGEDGVKNATESGKPAAKRIDTCTTNLAVYKRFRDADEELMRDREKVQGQINGNRPLNPTRLTRLGQGWRANFNAGEAEATRDSHASSYWSLLMDCPTLIQAKILGERQEPDELDYAEIIAEEYTETLTAWTGFFHNVLLHSTELFTFGKGPMCWTDRWDWRPKAFKDGQVLLSPRITSDVGEIEIFYVRDTLPISRASKLILDSEAAANFGWKIKALQGMMRSRFLKDEVIPEEVYQRDPLSSMQQAIRNRDSLLPFHDVDPIPIVHCFVREVSGEQKVSHYIHEDRLDAKEYLLEASQVYGSIENTLCMFTNGIGDGYMRSIRGLGQKMFPHIEVSNRFVCSAVDSARISGGLLVTGGAKDEPQLKMIGPIIQLPDGVQPVSTSFTPRLDQLIGVRTMLQQILNNNFGVYQKAIEHPGMPDRTRAEVVIAEEKEARFSNFSIVIYYTHWDRCHREIFRRLTDPTYPSGHPGQGEAADFKRRCIERGVPAEYLNSRKCRVKSMRAIGAGSPAIRKMTTTELLQVIAMLPYKGQMALLREHFAARTGYSNLDRFGLSPRDTSQAFTAEHTIARLETNDMAEGTPMEVPFDQPHLIHLEAHMAPLEQIGQELMLNARTGAGFDPTEIAPYFDVAIPHIQQTIEYALQDPRFKPGAKQFAERFAAVLDTYAAIQREQQRRERAEMQAMEQQAREMEDQMAQQSSPELAAKLEKVRGELAIRAQKVEGEMRLKEFRTRHDAMLKEIRLREDLKRKDMEAMRMAAGAEPSGRSA